MKVYCIRHGESKHNVDYKIKGKEAFFDISNRDPHLTENGVIESTRMYFRWLEKSEVECVLVSPLSRTLETAQCIFGKNNNIPIIATDILLESPQGSHLPNFRETKSYLEMMYSTLDFSELEEYQKIYEEEETAEELSKRVDLFKEYLLNLNKSCIAVVGHNSFFKCLFNTNEKIEHCKPMELII